MLGTLIWKEKCNKYLMEKKAAYFFISCCKEEHFHAGTWAVKPRFNAVRPDSPLRYHHYMNIHTHAALRAVPGNDISEGVQGQHPGILLEFLSQHRLVLPHGVLAIHKRVTQKNCVLCSCQTCCVQPRGPHRASDRTWSRHPHLSPTRLSGV
jgi:hypothetical protein